MRLLLVSDLHANLAALRAVLADAAPRGFETVCCLGDMLGYGPRPREVLALLRELGGVCLLGNHDAWALQLARGETPLRGDGVVAQALRWQLGQLSEGDLAWLARCPEVCDHPDLLPGGTVRFRHGSPLSMLTYVDSLSSAREAFAGWDGKLCGVGHTHLPAVYATLNAPGGEWIKHQGLSAGGQIALPPGARVILNPGSVGQPRDGDPRASYALLDTARAVFEVFRVAYDVAETQAAVRAAGLPEVLGARLAVGK